MAYTDIDKPTDYFNTVLYTGNGTARDITGVGFQPDWTWIKSRSQAYSHTVWDSVRGAGQRLITNATDSEETQTNDMSAFLSDGFSLGTGNITNQSSQTYASWNWLASNTTASNTDGSITSTVSANTTSGFSIVSYTGNGTAGATIGHSLGSVPKMIIVKSRSDVGVWAVYNENIGNSNGLFLNETYNALSEPAFWNSTSPTSSVFSVGTSNDTNGSSRTYIAYCFAEKKGFSKFGSYTGNGNADGTFIYTGFRPAFVMLKRTDASGERWNMKDNKRNGFNQTDPVLTAEANFAERDDAQLDLLSNGFKIRTSAVSTNASGGTYIYMAFAENPLVGTNNIPATAR